MSRHPCDVNVAPEVMSRPRCDLIVFADDWGRHPSSAQHLVQHLLDDCDVSWINTVGTRAPRLDFSTAQRAALKLSQWRRAVPRSSASAGPRVYSPIMYPGYRSSWQRKLNAALLARFMRETFDRLDQATVVSTVPIVADLPDRLRAKRWVYYCVDDFSAWPGLDAEPMRSMESTFVRRADRIIAAGANLAERMGALGRSADIITHGVDLDHWRAPVRPTAIFDGLLRPIVLFWGLIDRRLDIQALSALDRLMSQGTIVFAGPEQNPDPALRELARARCIGVIPFDTLPSLAAQAAVLIVPYADLPVTRAMQPLKLKEYLATERPVVTTRLPAVTGWEECLDVSNGPENFATLVLRRLNTGLPREQVAGRKRLRQESWGVKSAKFAEILFND